MATGLRKEFAAGGYVHTTREMVDKVKRLDFGTSLLYNWSEFYLNIAIMMTTVMDSNNKFFSNISSVYTLRLYIMQ